MAATVPTPPTAITTTTTPGNLQSLPRPNLVAAFIFWKEKLGKIPDKPKRINQG
jgi:hypothetical protein